jgi:hypothetical protein
MRPLVKLARKPTSEGMAIVNTTWRVDLAGIRSGKTSLSATSSDTGGIVCSELNLLSRSDVGIRDLVWERDSSSMASSVCVTVIDDILWRWRYKHLAV